MASISSAGSFTIPAAQPARRQAERSVSATETELTVKQEQQVQRVDDNQSRKASEQANKIENKQASSSLAQAEDKKSAEQLQAKQRLEDGEQQKIEAAQQEAQRAEFDQQAGNVRETEPNDVRPPSSSESPSTEQIEQDEKDIEITNTTLLQADSPAIDTFKQLQNFDAPSRQGQGINQFA